MYAQLVIVDTGKTIFVNPEQVVDFSAASSWDPEKPAPPATRLNTTDGRRHIVEGSPTDIDRKLRGAA